MPKAKGKLGFRSTARSPPGETERSWALPSPSPRKTRESPLVVNSSGSAPFQAALKCTDFPSEAKRAA